MGKATSAVEIIGDFKYIVERREDGTIICQSFYDRPATNIIWGVNLWDRFEEAEQENLVGSVNKKIKKFLYELRIRSTFDLTDQRLRDAVCALETASIIGLGRAAVILAISV